MVFVQLQFCRLEVTKFLPFQKPSNEKVQKFSWNTEALLIHFPIFSSPCGHPNTQMFECFLFQIDCCRPLSHSTYEQYSLLATGMRPQQEGARPATHADARNVKSPK